MARRTRRAFSAAFKAQVLRDLLSGQRLDLLFHDHQQRDPQQARIDELEQLLGRQTLELEILKKASRRLPGHPDANGRSS